MDFRLKFRPVTLRTPRIMNKACAAARKNYELVFAPFTLPYSYGTVASQIVATADIPLTSPWTIRVPISRPANNFVAVVRYVDGLVVRRYKLWSGIGEVLPVPQYIGETLPAGTVIELWTVPNQTPQLSSTWILKLGLLETPSAPCDQDGTDIVPTVVAAPYPVAKPFPNLPDLG